LLGCEICRRPEHLSFLGEPVERGGVEVREPEVEDGHPPVRADEDVGWLEVAVDAAGDGDGGGRLSGRRGGR
jgi:hypothetical protein